MTPFTDFERAIAAENLEQLETMIGIQVKGFQSKYWWVDHDDLLSAAGNAYITAVGTYCAEKGSLRNWVSFTVDKALKTVIRNTTQRFKNTKNFNEHEILEAFPEPEKDERFWLDEWLATIPADARQVAMMVFDTPFSVFVRIAELGGFETPEAFRNGVREYLRDAGWTDKRIEMAFTSIRQAL